ncbi:MAG: cation transporter, partial [Streptococcaceae bacterium]|nr:cation transporter [Streptococcaceae bacterium]
MEKKEFILEGLGCANCALKMETQIGKMNEINTCHVNFATQKLTLEVCEKFEKATLNKMTKIIEDIEPDVKIVEKEQLVNKANNSQELLMIGISLLIGTIGLLVEMPYQLKFSIILVAYVIIGHKVLYKAFKNILK